MNNSECIVCLEDIDNMSDIFLLECCNNPVHINCLNDWVKKNHSKISNIDKCFICNQNNEIIFDIVKSTKENIIIPIVETEVTNITISNYNSNNRILYIICCIGSSLLLSFIFFFTIL